MRYGRKWIAAVAMGLLSLNAMAQKLTEYVDPFIGTTNFSVCNPGAVLPHGLMSVVPFNYRFWTFDTIPKNGDLGAWTFYGKTLL